MQYYKDVMGVYVQAQFVSTLGVNTWPLYPRENSPSIHSTRDWEFPSAVFDAVKKRKI
jgi:hypothetical protein